MIDPDVIRVIIVLLKSDLLEDGKMALLVRGILIVCVVKIRPLGGWKVFQQAQLL